MAGAIPPNRTIYHGKRVTLEMRYVVDEDGKTREREVVVHPGAAVILPILPDGRVILIRNRRDAVDKTLLELPAGTIDPGENAEACAGRELIEETGYRAGKLTLLGAFYSSPGVMNEKLWAYLAEDLTEDRTNLDEEEKIESEPMTLAAALARLDDGTIEDGKTIATLLLHQRRMRKV